MTTTTPLELTIRPLPEAQEAPTGTFFSGETPSFEDVLDVVNPLQHIPIVSSVYRSQTGDTASSAARILGATLLGGPIGLIASIFNLIIENETGTDFAGNVIAAFTGEPVPALNKPVSEVTQTALSTASSYQPTSRHAVANAYLKAQSLLA